MLDIVSKEHAQQRVDQINAFQDELALLEDIDILCLSEPQKNAVNQHQKELIKQLGQEFDVDVNLREKHLSLGMRIASFLGALGLTASVFFLFYQFWGNFSVANQVIILVTAPIVLLAVTGLLNYQDKTGYFVKLLALVTIACFVLNLVMLGHIFNITPSANAFLVWALFSWLLAYACNARLLLSAAIICFAFYLSAQIGAYSGMYWLSTGERPENFFLVSIVLFFLGRLNHHKYWGFTVIYRVFSLLLFFIPVLVLSHWGNGSYLPLDAQLIEGSYQIIGFVVAVVVMFYGIKRQHNDMVNTGNIFFTIFLYTKFFDWWWDWMPKYLFFLLVALTAVLMLLIFKRLRIANVEMSKVQP